jgi:hypothetical protein
VGYHGGVSQPHLDPRSASGGYGPPPGGPPPPPGGGWGPPPGGHGGDPYGYGPPKGGGWGAPPGAIQPQPGAPYGIHPVTGQPYSEKSKVVAGLLQIFMPFGLGRFYTGHTRLGVIQMLVVIFTCGIGSLWPFIDGIMMLTGSVPDSDGRPLREGV